MELSPLVRFAVAAVLVLAGCSDEVPTRTASGAGGSASAGTEGRVCYPNGTCNGVLDCVDGRCEGANADTGVQCNVFTGEGCEDSGSIDTRGCPAGYVRIAPGTFTMGSPIGEVGREIDETQHSVTITRAFCMKATEVTQGEWQAEAGGNPSAFQECGLDCPVEQVSWDDAIAYANALSRREGLPECYTGSTFAGLDCAGYRLPTESEWEYAARAGTTGPSYGLLESVGWYSDNSGESTQAVGGKAANSFGLYDMLGNVFEWTGDWYGPYTGSVIDPTGAATGVTRVLRGGSWDGRDLDSSAAARNDASAGYDFGPDVGFRLVRTVP